MDHSLKRFDGLCHTASLNLIYSNKKKNNCQRISAVYLSLISGDVSSVDSALPLWTQTEIATGC
jgi:hypothetical protein